MLVSPGGDVQTLPPSLHDFLMNLAGRLNEGQSVSIVQDDDTLTTTEAAATLGTSRQFLVNLLEQGVIAYHKVGSHRRIYSRDLFEYKTKRDLSRRAVLRDLARAEVEEGLYDRVPTDAGR
jgi:excisionase family DNA binding protein